MASENGRKNPTLIEQLFKHPYKFNFFQAVRILELWTHEQSEDIDPKHARTASVGTEALPRREFIRFRALNSSAFQAGGIKKLLPPEEAELTDPENPASEMTVSFLGLTGPSGVLPFHYTSMIIERCHVSNKDYSMRDFFDLFNHRTVSLFFRAWEKYRYPFAYERVQRAAYSEEEDLFTYAMRCFVGLGTPGLRDRSSAFDATVVYYGGHFAHHPRSALALECLLEDYFGVTFNVHQFQGCWIYLDPENQSAFPSAEYPEGLNLVLGQDTIIGDRIWDVKTKFRIVMGPMGYKDFLRFLPIGNDLRPLWDLTRLYVGPELAFDVQPILKKEEVPMCQLGGDGYEPRLGWNTWVHSEPMPEDAKDAVLVLKDL